ncbi:bifunctional metallophosphatase/5'-nucleotidase [Anoxynatronum buryatiense]|uniref:2',3'-cyclic-nucleotide 2'-phosphodiesterase / 3'-nucleotidase n=1 Tax=Anoxynatronum buryatiense TaxID=489973 RepID=A0AA45X0A0_9CLOT|nr:bifunctional UDP-sugar hydrolase/5'-nucleotidase [Anoxynatronum buryatiense]SMP71184.1 2',3'-cyclic-nucleotide 2'-phosphodiesterase / 3'-nucleotidase [Anoxynatronum buryatiense]
MKQKVCILCTSDLHGQLMPSGNPAVQTGETQPLSSLAQIATLIEAKRQQGDPVLYIDNGDAIQGSALVHVYGKDGPLENHPMVEALSQLKCDGAVIGNHEFHYGLEALQQVVALSPFPWLSANCVHRETGEPAVGLPYIIRKLGSVTVAVIGLTTRVFRQVDEHIVLEDEIDTLAYWIKRIKNNHEVDVVVVAYHGGTQRHEITGKSLPKPEENRGLEMLATFPEIDVLLTGHQHRRFVQKLGRQVVVQPGALGTGLGAVTLHLSRGAADDPWTITSVEAGVLTGDDSESLQLLENGELTVPPAISLIDRLAAFEKEALKWESEVVANLTTPCPINDLLIDICINEHPLVQWMHGILMERGSTEMSVLSVSNSLFKGLKAGAVTRGDLLRFFPFPDDLWVVQIKGEAILAMLETAATIFEPDDTSPVGCRINDAWRSPMVRIHDYQLWKGIDYTFDIEKSPGRRLTACTFQGKPLDLETLYTVTTTTFMAHQMAYTHGIDPFIKVKQIPGNVPDLLMEDAAKGGLNQVQVVQNRQFLTKSGSVHFASSGNHLI